MMDVLLRDCKDEGLRYKKNLETRGNHCGPHNMI